jgi:hypothetical protein
MRLIHMKWAGGCMTSLLNCIPSAAVSPAMAFGRQWGFLDNIFLPLNPSYRNPNVSILSIQNSKVTNFRKISSKRLLAAE